jgi:hypothetical protein
VNPDYESLTFKHDFGQAANFAYFEGSSGELMIEPGLATAGSYSLYLTIIDGADEYTRLITLLVNAPSPDQLTEESVEQEPTDNESTL